MCVCVCVCVRERERERERERDRKRVRGGRRENLISNVEREQISMKFYLLEQLLHF